jgi:hypothetical protein
MTIYNKYLDGRQFHIVDNLGMNTLRCASRLFCVVICAGMSLFGQEPALRDVDQQLNQLSALEQKGQYAQVVQPVSLLIESKALNERETGRAQLLRGGAADTLRTSRVRSGSSSGAG